MADTNSESSKERLGYCSSRRTFFKQAAAASFTISGAGISYLNTEASHQNVSGAGIPWYRRITRWGQTNITEPACI